MKIEEAINLILPLVTEFLGMCELLIQHPLNKFYT